MLAEDYNSSEDFSSELSAEDEIAVRKKKVGNLTDEKKCAKQ